MNKNSFYLLLLSLLILFGCKKSPNSTSQGNTNPPPQAGHHYLTDTTINFPTGLVPSTLAELLSVPVLDTSVLPVCETRTSISSIDPAYDLSKNIPGIPPPQMQTWGNCSAWAVGYGMMSYLYAVKGGYSDYNLTDKTFSPAFIYNQKNGLVDHGISLPTALEFIRDAGCCKWMYMPEFITYFTIQPSPAALANAANYRITNGYRMTQVDINYMKILIDVWKYPLAFSCTVDRGFKYADSPSWKLMQGNRYVWKGLNGDTTYGHSMLIVGYDDAINAFKVLNSWGKQWGALKFNDPNNDGYCWIDYDVFKKVVTTNLDNSGNYLPEIFIGTLVSPIVVTALPTSTTSTTALSGGNITYDGNNLILSRGVCWSTKTNPTTSDNEILGGSGIGAFSSTLSGLTEGQTYYVRAFAVTGAGTTYGNEVSFNSSSFSATTLLTGLEYPEGLWINGNTAYLTETAGRNTLYGGKLSLDKFDLSTNIKTVLKNNPENSDALVVTYDGKIYLSSYQVSIPGNNGTVSVFDMNTLTETHLLDIEIATEDMFLNSSNDIVLIGSSDLPTAKSLYLLPSTNYTNPSILKTGLGRVRCVSQNGSDIYFSDFNAIKYFGSDGIIKIFSNISVESMSFSSQYLYYVDELGGKVGRINIQTGINETLVSNLASPGTVRYDSSTKKLYLLERGTDANKFKDGTLKVISDLQ